MKDINNEELIFGSIDWFNAMNKMDSSWIYRYRPYNNVTLKELLYNEVYFAYGDELNDPLDLYADLIIKKGDDYVLSYFIMVALKRLPINRSNKDLTEKEIKFAKDVASDIVSNDLIYISKFLNTINKTWFEKKFNKYNLHKKYLFNEFYSYFVDTIENLYPQNLTSVSFSNDSTNPVLWSNFSNGHYGFCLIFSPASGKLRLRKNNSIEFKEFEYFPISYDNDKTLDLSLLFNIENKDICSDKIFTEFLPLIQRNVLLKKLKCYEPERELRIHGGYGISFPTRIEEIKKETSFERIYYYDLDQLAGIILGLKLKEKEKDEIKSIIKSFKKPVRVYEAYLDNCSIKTQIIQS